MRQSIVLALVLCAGLVASGQRAEAGRVPRPGADADVVAAYGSVTYGNEWFAGCEYAQVRVVGDGDTVLRVAVYDENDNLIATDSGDTCVATFYPRWTGRFRVVVSNLGGVANRFALTTN